MKILLLTPPWSYYELRNPGIEKLLGLKACKDISGQGVLCSQGILQLASVLREVGHEVCLVDGYLKNISEITDYALRENPRLIGISTITCLWEKTKVLLRELRESSPGSFLVIGGPHSTFAKEKCLEESGELDAAVIGEGEWPLKEIANRIDSGSGIEGITGVVLRNGSKILNSAFSWQVEDLDKLPLPAYDLVDVQNYIPNITFMNKTPFMHIFTSRGCSMRCSFCSYSHSSSYRFKGVDYLMAEIEYLIDFLGVRTINFYDDCNIFSYNRDKAYAFCELLRKLKRQPKWSIYLINFSIPNDMLREMKRSGCFMINCLIESGVQGNRDYICGKHFPLKKIAEKISAIKKIGISATGRFQFGIPGETYAQGLKTVDFACSLPLDYGYFIRALLTPGSGMFDVYLKMGRISPDSRTWNAYSEFFNPDGMTLDEFSSLIKAGYARFYRRPNWWIARLMRFWKWRLYGSYFKRIRGNRTA